MNRSPFDVSRMVLSDHVTRSKMLRSSATMALCQQVFKSRFSLLPAPHQLRQQAVEGRAMVMISQMAEFMNDYVVNAIARRLSQVGIQRQQAVPRRVAPAGAHSPRSQAKLDRAKFSGRKVAATLEWNAVLLR